MTTPVISTLGTLSLAGAALLTLVLLIETRAFTASPPQGADAMGLFVVVLAMGARWLLTFVPALLCLWRGSFDWVSTKPGVPGLVVIGAMIGLGVLFAISWIQWTAPARWFTPLAGNIGAFAIPLLVQFYLVVLLWKDPSGQVSRGATSVGVVLLAAGVLGAGVGVTFLGISAVHKAERNRQAIAEHVRASQEQDRRNALTVIDRLREDLAAMPEGSQFWQVAGYFDQCETAEHRQLVVQAIDRLISGCEQLEANLVSEYPSFRHRAAIYVVLASSIPESVGGRVARAIEMLAGNLSTERSLRGREGEDFGAYLETLVAAARRFPPHHLSKPLTRLRAAAEQLSDPAQRSHALHVIDAMSSGASVVDSDPEIHTP